MPLPAPPSRTVRKGIRRWSFPKNQQPKHDPLGYWDLQATSYLPEYRSVSFRTSSLPFNTSLSAPRLLCVFVEYQGTSRRETVVVGKSALQEAAYIVVVIIIIIINNIQINKMTSTDVTERTARCSSLFTLVVLVGPQANTSKYIIGRSGEEPS